MSITQDLRTRAKHRALKPWQLIQKIGRLEREADGMACQLVALATEIDELKAERNDLKDSLDAAAIDYSGALEDLRIEREENARLTAELANRDAITVPPMERDTSAIEDRATAPIDVRPLWDALGAVVQVSASGASADPTGLPRQTTWGRAADIDDTQPLKAIEEVAS